MRRRFIACGSHSRAIRGGWWRRGLGTALVAILLALPGGDIAGAQESGGPTVAPSEGTTGAPDGALGAGGSKTTPPPKSPTPSETSTIQTLGTVTGGSSTGTGSNVDRNANTKTTPTK